MFRTNHFLNKSARPQNLMKRWNVKQFAFRTFIEISAFSISNWQQQHFQKSFFYFFVDFDWRDQTRFDYDLAQPRKNEYDAIFMTLILNGKTG